MARSRHKSHDAADREIGLGFRRIAAVRLWTGEGSPRYEVEGVVHRLPVTRPITAGMAARLIAGGVPLVVRGPVAATKRDAVPGETPLDAPVPDRPTSGGPGV